MSISGLDWQDCCLHELAPARLYALLAARESVFVVEQRCAYQELDGRDLSARHLVAWQGGAVVACLRLLPPGGSRRVPAIGRVLVMPAWRGRGLGRTLMLRGLALAAAHYPGAEVCVSAQARLQDFYVSLGFTATSGIYDEDGIAHVDMRLAGQ